MKAKQSWIYLLVLLFVCINSYANPNNNNALYAPVAPEGSAFIRVINLSNENVTLDIKGKSSSLDIPSKKVGDFVFVPAGEVVVQVAGKNITKNLVEQQVISLVLTKNKTIVPFEDTFFDNRRKAKVIFYNLSDKELSLKTTDGKFALLDGVGTDMHKSRLTNEVKVGLGLFADEGSLLTIEPHFFQKGRCFSFVSYQENGVVKLIQSDDKVAPIQ